MLFLDDSGESSVSPRNSNLDLKSAKGKHDPASSPESFASARDGVSVGASKYKVRLAHAELGCTSVNNSTLKEITNLLLIPLGLRLNRRELALVVHSNPL